MATANQFRVKKEMYEKLTSLVEELESNISCYEESTADIKAKDPEERHYWEQSSLEDYPVKIEAIKKIISHLEKLL